MCKVTGPDGITGEVGVSTACGKKAQFVTINTNALPNVIRAYEPMRLQWSIREPGATEFVALTTTAHDVYVIYGSPHEYPTRKRLSNVCSWASGQSTPDGIAQQVYNYLSAHDPPHFNLGSAVPEGVDPWRFMNAGQAYWTDCEGLAMLMQRACQVVGVNTAAVGYMYATTDNVNFFTGQKATEAWEWKALPDANGVLQRYNLWFHSGGWNKYQAVCRVGTQYYAPKVTQKATTMEIIKFLVCPNTIASDNFQCWARRIGPSQVECHPSQYPVPLPGAPPNGCP